MDAFLSNFSVIPDPRASNVRHVLMDVLFIALASVLCGAKTCTEMALFGRSRESDLREILDLSHGVPSHDTFSKVFRHMDPQALEQAFRDFTHAFNKELSNHKQIAVDGKVLRRSYKKGKAKTPQAMVSAWGTQMRVVLGSRSLGKDNEITAAIKLLKTLDINGAIITADALHCNKKMVTMLVEHSADYVICLKGNRGPLFKDAKTMLADDKELPEAQTRERIHGREETRRAIITPALDLATKHKFKGLVAIGRINATRTTEAGSHEATTRYFVLSRMMKPSELLQIVRKHWGIENSLHWVLDVVFDEDLARSRCDHGAQNIAVLRRLALNIINGCPEKGSIKGKMKRAGWDNSFLLQLLGHMR